MGSIGTVPHLLERSTEMSTTKSQFHLIEAVPVPAGVAPFQQGVLESSGVAVELFQFGNIIVALSEDSLLGSEIVSVTLDGR